MRRERTLEKKEKRRFGDRRDGKLLRNLDSMHFIMPIIYPNRCDNEAYLSERIDLENINAYLAKKNADNPDFKYKLFHVILTTMVKTLYLRPKMNRFIANSNMYQRNEVTAAFTIKKTFEDESEEALAFIHTKPTDTIDTIRDFIRDQVTSCRSDKADAATDNMDFFNKLPRFLSKAIVRLVMKLEKRGKAPKSLNEGDPYYSSCVLSNVGSIKLKCGYHHLTNWGTTSLFCLIGEKKMTPRFDENGNAQMRETVDIGLTIDERIADGFYYAKSLRLIKHLLQNPELLELPLSEPVEY